MKPWQHHFRNLMADAEVCFDGQDYEGARLRFQEAFKLIPEPRVDHEESTQAVTALGDCFFQLGNYERAIAAFEDVLHCPGGSANPFIRLRRGQVLYKLQKEEQARIELTTAYLNGGRDVFEGEDEYLALIADIVQQLP